MEGISNRRGGMGNGAMFEVAPDVVLLVDGAKNSPQQMRRQLVRVTSDGLEPWQKPLRNQHCSAAYGAPPDEPWESLGDVLVQGIHTFPECVLIQPQITSVGNHAESQVEY